MCFSAALCAREEFLQIMKLNSTDLLTVKLWLDKKVSDIIFEFFWFTRYARVTVECVG